MPLLAVTPPKNQVGEQWERALALLQEIPGYGMAPCVISYNTAISACAKCGKGDDEVREKIVSGQAFLFFVHLGLVLHHVIGSVILPSTAVYRHA